MHANGKDDIELMVRVLSIFGNVITSAGFSTNYRHWANNIHFSPIFELFYLQNGSKKFAK